MNMERAQISTELLMRNLRHTWGKACRPAGTDNINDRSIAPFLGRNTGTYYPYWNGSDVELPPIPVEWIIAPVRYSDQLDKCPTSADTIRAFVLADFIAIIIATVICCRPLLCKLSCGLLGAKSGGRGVYWTWIGSFALELLGNVISSLVVVRTDGYEQLSMINVFALYASRPRLKAWWVAILRILVVLEHEHEHEHPYVDGYIGSALAEQLLQIIAAAFIGTTWDAFPNEPIKEWMHGSLIYMMVVPGITLITILLVVPIWRRNCEAWRLHVDNKGDPALLCVRIFITCIAAFFFIVIYTAPWIYWTKFLKLPGSLWCPPALAEQAAIWAGFSSLGA
ncbi:hypothetical protein DV738_g4991, partial [Chaetothyriales sp. CBS 135597]